MADSLPLSDAAARTCLPPAASAAVDKQAHDTCMENRQHQPDPDAASAGRSGASRKPALLQLDQDALKSVLAKLEPEALATAGLHNHSTCLRDFVQEASPRARGEAGRPFFGVHFLACLMHLLAFSLQQSIHTAGCASRSLRTAAESEQLWQQHCTARWKYPNKHLRQAGERRYLIYYGW